MRKDGLLRRIFGIPGSGKEYFRRDLRYDYYFYLRECRFRFHAYVADEDLSREEDKFTARTARS